MISYAEALAILQRHAGPARAESVPLSQALGGVAAEDISSPMNVPSFRNSAMDGYAVRASALATASAAIPVTLSVSGTVAAGDALSLSGEAVQIMTGAPVPGAFDAVVPVEMVCVEGERVTFTRPASPKDHIRFPGEDVCAGETVLRRGDKVTPEAVMLLSALGIAKASVRRVPRIHFISTGNEITDNPVAPLPEGMIYNSNAPYLLASARALGLEAVYEGIVRDDPAAYEAMLGAIKEAAVIVSTGAVSKGSRDFIPDSLKKLGGAIHFHRVNIRPGKPVLFATLPNGSFYFGLPGNPISTAIGFTFFVMPLVRMLQGAGMAAPLMAQLANDFTKKGDFRQFLKANLAVDGEGRLRVSVATGQESFKIKSMTENNAWVVLEEGKTLWRAGECVPVYPYGAMETEKGENSLCQAA
ncbi:MAG: molybdopterin molybdotransferase MoeA [Alphaproteobacteria bacterium]|nr:molybdopterin molybdotransferase MoeA [Alphaproteobacteria bacterium]